MAARAPKHRKSSVVTVRSSSVVTSTAVAAGLLLSGASAASANTSSGGHAGHKQDAAVEQSTKPSPAKPSTGGHSATEHSGSASKPKHEASATTRYNDQDVAFLTHMIHHHGQAVVMAKWAEKRARTEGVHSLAHQITEAQMHELEVMSRVLHKWGQPVADPEHFAHGVPAGSPHAAMPGMMTEAQMHELGHAHGVEFERMWLHMMIEHHRGALKMAEKEILEGKSRGVRRLALRMYLDQQAEIDYMQRQLRVLGG